MLRRNLNFENSSLVLAQLRRMIDAGETGQDGRLPTERELSAMFSVGRRAVRRAVEVLEAEGLLWRRQGKGTFIGQPPDPTGALAAQIAGETAPADVMEARLCIEPALASLCARRARPEDVQRMRRLAARTFATADPDATELWDGALHHLIALTAGNRLLMTAFSMLDEVRTGEHWRELRERARSPRTKTLYDNQHHAIIDAIEAGDAAGAEAAMRTHLIALAERLEHAGGPRHEG
ncbi:FCD domain-containing protein [bacterium]|nr:FCD domain-containing protein [bacterium]